MLGSIAKFFGVFPNPTARWSPPGSLELVYDLTSRSLNGLCLDAPFDEAQIFGPCDDWEQSGEYIDLFYRKQGLSLEFASKRLLSVLVVVARGSFLAKRKKLEATIPIFIDLSARRHALTDTSTLQDLVPCFGKPSDSGPVGEDFVYTFLINKNFVDTYHDPKTGRLLQIEINETNDS